MSFMVQKGGEVEHIFFLNRMISGGAFGKKPQGLACGFALCPNIRTSTRAPVGP